MKISKFTAKYLFIIISLTLTALNMGAKEIADLEGTIEKARGGTVRAQSDLVSYYYNAKKDYSQAIYWCGMLLENPDADDNYKEFGCRILGLCNYYGRGTEKSIPKAVKHLKEGVKYKGKDCAYQLARINEKELKDSIEAINWYKKAADLNEEYSALFLGKLYENGYYEKSDKTKVYYPDISRNISEAAKYYLKYIGNMRVVNGSTPLNSKMMYKVGLWFYDGEGNLEKDFEKACRLLLDAVESSDGSSEKNRLTDEEKGDALWLVSVCYRFGRGVEQDELIARRYAKKAAEYGNEKALKSLEMQKPL